MSNLYTNLSEIYEIMYQTFINYDEEYSYYSAKLKKYNIKSVVELGCGTGNLAKKFIADGFEYTGIDLNDSMLKIAERKKSGGEFSKADMRNFRLDAAKDACLFAGRTSAYLITNRNILDALKSIYTCLNNGGIVCFDCIDAEKFLPLIKSGNQIVHTAEFGGRKFYRESYWSVNTIRQGVFNWDSIYYEVDQSGALQEIGKDNSVIRAFTKDDIQDLLVKSGFKIRDMEDRLSYAFDTFVVLAQK